MGTSVTDIGRAFSQGFPRPDASLYRRALEFHDKGMLPHAVRMLKLVLDQVDGTSGRAYVLEVKASYGRFLFLSGRTAKGFSYLSEALKISIEDRDGEAMSRVLGDLGEIYGAWGNPMLSLEYLVHALWHLRDSEDHDRHLRCLAALALIHARLAYPDECAQVLSQLDDAADRAKSEIYKRYAQVVRAEVFVNLGAFGPASALDRMTLPAGPEGWVREIRVRSLKCQGLLELYAGRPASAGEFFHEMLRELRRLQYRHGEAEGLVLAARACRESGDADRDAWLIAEALKMAKRIENRGIEAQGMLHAFQGRGDERALVLLGKGLEIARQVGDRELILGYQHRIAMACAALGRHEEALDASVECRKELQRLAAMSAAFGGRIEQRRDLRRALLDTASLSDPVFA